MMPESARRACERNLLRFQAALAERDVLRVAERIPRAFVVFDRRLLLAARLDL